MKNWRIDLVLSFFFLFTAAIVGRLVILQIVNGDFYAALARGQQKVFESMVGDRGEIFFQNHKTAVVTTEEDAFVYLSPAEVPADKRDSLAQTLSDILSLDKSFILTELQREESLYEVIKEDISQDEVAALQEINIKGVYLGGEKKRDYPYGGFASHLLGFTNDDGRGQYGIEEYYNNSLQGKETFEEGERGPLGYFFPDSDVSANQGSDLNLTIDYNIQYFAERLLQQAQEDLAVEGGTIIVIDPNTGKLLALAESPNFNPEEYAKVEDSRIFMTDATQKVFEPGSVFKPLTMAAAIDQGKIAPETTFQDPGVLKIDGWSIYNYGERQYPGDITMTEVLEKSINTGAVFAQVQLGDQKFADYVAKFGVFEKTGVDLPAELLPANAEFKKGHKINYATASFGQGIEVTPMQLVRAYCAIANGGNLVKPYIVETEPEISANKVISSATASKVTAMMVSVVQSAYTKAAQVPGYYVAGKTGTAQVSYAALGINKSGYSDKTWQSFIGFAPAFNPKFLILVKLNNPETKTAEYSAVPVFQKLAKYIIDYYQIPPDHEE
jgi:cell division protein FtsI/penicillin-binding protein 2